MAESKSGGGSNGNSWTDSLWCLTVLYIREWANVFSLSILGNFLTLSSSSPIEFFVCILPIINLTCRNSFFLPELFLLNSSLFLFCGCNILLNPPVNINLSVVGGMMLYVLFHSLNFLFPQESVLSALLGFHFCTLRFLPVCLSLRTPKSRSIYLGSTGFDTCERWEGEKVSKMTFSFYRRLEWKAEEFTKIWHLEK